MKKIRAIWRSLMCSYCRRVCEDTGGGSNMGTYDKPMCERCYENGGDC